jgi:hypothetical protein
MTTPPGSRTVEVELNQQQRELLERLRRRRGLTASDGELVRLGFAEYVKQALPGGKAP